MAIAVKRGFGGGGAKPKQIFLYKKGVDNTQLTGGLDVNSYTFYSGYSKAGTVTFNANDINMDVNTSGNNYCMFGTTIPIDFTDYKSVIVTYRVWNDNTPKTLTCDVSALAGSAYISFTDFHESGGNHLAIAVSTAKTNVWGSGRLSAQQSDYQNNYINIDSIELIPYDEPIVQTILGDLTGGYTGLATKTSAIEVPTIQSGQKLRLVGKNNVSTTYNYQVNVAFSTDGTNWVTIYTSSTIPFPTSGASTTLNIDVSNVFGNRGYFRVFISGDSRSSNTITSAIVGIFRD